MSGMHTAWLSDNRPTSFSFLWDVAAQRPSKKLARLLADDGPWERVMGLEPTTFCLGSRHSAN